MDALNLNYWMTKFSQEVAKPSKEGCPQKTPHQIMCGIYVVTPESKEPRRPRIETIQQTKGEVWLRK